MSVFLKQLLSPHQYWRRVFILSVSIVLLGLFIAIAKTHYGTIHRLRNVEYQHQLLLKEISGSPDFKRASELVFNMILLRSKDRQQYRSHISTLNTIHALVLELQKIKDSTSLGGHRHRERTDYALSTAGAQILSTGRTKVMLTPLPQWMSVFGLSGISKLFVNGAHRVIQPSNEPGECFAFSGHGEVIIKLIKAISIDAVTVEHIPPNISPDGHILSAPSLFSVYGMETANEPHNPYHLGTFKYDIELKQSRQEFQVANINKSFSIVKLEFAPNPSPLNYTCIYRIRVHGSLPTKSNWARAQMYWRPFGEFQCGGRVCSLVVCRVLYICVWANRHLYCSISMYKQIAINIVLCFFLSFSFICFRFLLRFGRKKVNLAEWNYYYINFDIRTCTVRRTHAQCSCNTGFEMKHEVKRNRLLGKSFILFFNFHVIFSCISRLQVVRTFFAWLFIVQCSHFEGSDGWCLAKITRPNKTKFNKKKF